MSKLDDLKELLKELFQLDQPDLDFGIYRIMHYRAAEIESFLEEDLLPQVRQALDAYSAADRNELKRQLEAACDNANKLGVDPDTVPKVAELRAKIAGAAETDRMETEVYSDLYRFFRRYYSGGDFLSLRRRHAGEVYSIPYSGEELKLHWANADQYYIKSSENLTNYAFKTHDGKRVRFELVAATTEKDNNKPQEGADRRYSLAPDYMSEESTSDGAKELVIRFEYRPGKKGESQKELNAKAAAAVGKDSGHLHWRRALLAKAPTDANPDRTVFEKRLATYTAKQSFDYFIHKDIGGFLRRELDFFIKNEIMHLDDIESETAPRVERYLAKVRAIRLVARKIIDFLAQLENFQKKLWLKKKFVISSGAIATIDRVNPALYAEIANNDSQLDEWATADKKLSALRKARANGAELEKYFEANSNLVVDSRYFDSDFMQRFSKETPDLDAFYSGTLFHAENHHALTALRRKLCGKVSFFYLDPPYNTGSDDFLYKDSYQYSSWMCMMFDRLHLARELLADDGAVAVSIDQHSLGMLRQLMDMIFGDGNIVSTITVQRATVSGPKVINPGVVNVCDYVLLYAKDRREWTGNAVYSERLRDSRYSTYIRNRDKDPAQWRFMSLLEAFAEHVGLPKSKLKRELGDDFEERIHNFVLDNSDAVAQPCLVRPGMVSAEFREKLKESAERPDEVVFFPRKGLSDVYLRNSKLLLFYSNKMQTVGKRKITAERASDIWTDVLPNDVHNEGGVTLGKGKKPEALLARLVGLGSGEGDLVADFFLGSGTLTAVAQKMGRRWIGIEMADYFESAPLQRMKNVLGGETRGMSDDLGWQGGGAFNFLRLESYDDSLDNIELVRQEAQHSLLTKNASLREEYVLKYMLDVESSGSILNVSRFSDPWAYQMRCTHDGETTLQNVDLVETFNLLLGLRVKRSGFDKDITFVAGNDSEDSEILVVWRRVKRVDSEKLNSWFEKQSFAENGSTFDKVYVNGDNLLGALRGDSDRWTVHLIEEAFHRLMFETHEG